MIQDYRSLTDDQLEDLEKQSLRTVVQALQEYSAEARVLFENTKTGSDSEVIVLAEDIVQYALEVAECYPINRRFTGFIDYKRVRWIGTPAGLLPQVLLVDAKASTESNRDTLQQSQLSMDAEFEVAGSVVTMTAGVPPHMDIPTTGGGSLAAVTTSLFVHFFYSSTRSAMPPFKSLHAIFALALPHQRLKPMYNPNSKTTYFGAGKHSPARGEVPRIRVYFSRLRGMAPWRLQELRYTPGSPFTVPSWRDVAIGPGGFVVETNTPFDFIGR